MGKIVLFKHITLVFGFPVEPEFLIGQSGREDRPLGAQSPLKLVVGRGSEVNVR